MALVFLFLSFFLQGALGGIVCEELLIETCSFAGSSSGKRCSLETYASGEGKTVYRCRISEVAVKQIPEWIESDYCVAVCGLDRSSVGISSDSLLDPHFTAKLCAPSRFQNCPNIVDLYYLGLGEGVFLPALCEEQQANPRRAMSQILTSGVASGPISSSAAAGPASSELPVACSPTSI